MRISLPVCCTLLLLTIGCGGGPSSHPFYETTTFRHDTVTADYRSMLVAAVGKLAQKGKLRRRDGSGRVRTLKKAHVAKLDLATLRAIQMMSEPQFKGAEVDILVSVKGRGRVPVSVITDMKGRIIVERARKPPPGRTLKVRMPPLVKGSGSWTKTQKRNVALAMDQLVPAEAKVLGSIAFIRHRKSKDRSKGALYVQKNCAAEIRIYDRAFLPDKWQFAGSAYRPLPSSSRTVLHEVGHAIHNRPGRVAFCKYERFGKALQSRINRYNTEVKKVRRTQNHAAAKRLNAEKRSITKAKKKLERLSARAMGLSKRGPVLDRYAKALAGKPAPTSYGQTSIQESFAESFSLFRADPTALKRILPRVYKWFAAKGHLKALK